MAKGNLFQGMARGSVGDVVFSRVNGKQISKMRNRNPHNPRTNKQRYQRAIMATVLQAYKAGQMIFNHAWQGVPKGQQVQSLFLKRNAKLLRQNIVSVMATYVPQGQELNTNTRVVHPRATVPVPNRYQISQGSYNIECFEEVGSAGEWRLKRLDVEEFPDSWETYYKKVGLVEGDIYTFVWFQQTDSLAYRTETETGSIDPRRSVWNCNFVYARFRVLPPPTDTFDYSQPLTKVMEYTGGTARIGSYENYLNLRSALVIGNITGKYAWGLIRSREDSPLRSTSFTNSPRIATAYGIAPSVIGEVWEHNGQPLGTSDLILEGGGDDVTPAPVPPTPYAHRLLLQDNTITEYMPVNTNNVKGIEIENNIFVLKATADERKPYAGNIIDLTTPDPSIRSTLVPTGPNIPDNAFACNVYYMRKVAPIVKQFIIDIGQTEQAEFENECIKWVGCYEGQKMVMLSCQVYDSKIIGYDVKYDVDYTNISAGGYMNVGFTWLVQL